MNWLKSFLAAAAALAVAGVLALPLRPAARGGGESARHVGAARGGAAVFAVLGGYRSLLADFIWIRGYICWERKDIAKCVSSMELACDIDPAMDMFWVQASSVIAFDIPHWLFARLPAKFQTEQKMELLRARQARQAIKFIDRGLELNPDNYALLIQKGQIAIGARFFKEAEKCYGRAAALDDGFYARRIYASLLEKNGKAAEAVPVLQKLLADAEPDNPVRPLIAEQLARAKKTAELAK